MTNSLYFFDDTAFEARYLSELASRRTTWESMGQQITPDMYQSAIALSQTYPDLPTGIIQSAAQTGIQPTDPAMESLAENYSVDQQSGFNFMKTLTMPFEAAGTIGKGVVRTAATAFDMLWEEVIARPLRTTVGVYQGMSIPQAYGMAGRSYGVRAIDKWLKNPIGNTFDWMIPGQQVAPEDRVNLGSGFFAQSDQVSIDDPTMTPEVARLRQLGMSPEDAVAEANRQYGTPIVQNARQDAERIQISRGGKSSAVSPGRLLAITMFEPGTAGFNIMSGVADAAAQIYFDPADKLLKGVRLANLARNTLVPNGARKTTTLMGSTFGRLSPTINEFVDGSLGTDLANWTANTKNFSQIRSVYGRNVQGSAHIKWLKELTDTDDANRVKELIRMAYDDPTTSLFADRAPVNLGLTRRARRGMLSQGVGNLIGGEVGKFGGVRVAMKHRLEGSAMYRLFSEMGGAFVPVGDLAGGVDELEKFMNSAGFSSDEMSEYLYRMASVDENNYEEVLDVVRDAVNAFGARLQTRGIPEPVVKYMTDVFNTQKELRKYWINAAGNPASFPGSKTKIIVDGVEREQPTAHLISEFINRAIPLPDPRQVRKALHASMGPMNMVYRISDSADLRQGALSLLADNYMQKIWKPMTLIRVAWPVRVIGEEQIRMVGADLDSVFRHPLQYFGWALHDKSRFGNIWKGVARGETDLLGNELDEAAEFQKAMSTYASFGLDPVRHAGPGEWVESHYGDPRFYVGYTREVVQLANDPLARLVAQAGIDDIDNARAYGSAESAMKALKERFWDGDLRQYRMRFIQDSGNYQLLENRRWSDGYIDSLYARITDKTGGGYHYFDTDGRWYDGLTQKPLARSEIPLGMGDEPEGMRLLREFADVYDPSRIPTEQLTKEYAEAQIQNILNTVGADDPGWDALYESLAMVDEARNPQDIRRALENAQYHSRKYLESFPVYEPEVRSPLTGEGLENITGNEAQNLADFLNAPGGQEVMADSLETLGPMRKFKPEVLADDLPEGVPTFYGGVDPDHPAYIVIGHKDKHGRQLQTMAVRIEWSGDRVSELHIGSADVEDLIPNYTPGRDLMRLGRFIDEQGLLETTDIMDMMMGGVPVRDWIASSPALRAMDPEDVKKMSIDELISTVRQENGTGKYTLQDALEAVASREARDTRSGPNIMHLGDQNDIRKGTMYAQALRHELGDEWEELIDAMREGQVTVPRVSDVRDVWYSENPELDDMIEVVLDLMPQGSDPRQAAMILRDAALAEITANVDEYEQILIRSGRIGIDPRAADDFDALQSVMPPGSVRAQTAAVAPEEDLNFLRGRTATFAAPGNYPLSHKGAESMSFLAGRKYLTPEKIKQIPQDRPQYYVHTSGNVDLMRAIATGDLNGVSLLNVTSSKQAREIGTILRDQYSSYAPRVVKVNKEVEASAMNMWDRAITTMFSEFMSKPTNQLSRSPAFRQFYWKRVARMMPWMDDDARQEVIRRASEAGVEERFLRNELRNFLRRATGRERISAAEAELQRIAQVDISGPVSGGMKLGPDDGEFADIDIEGLGKISLDNLEAMDEVAKAFALQETQTLLYDITRKHDITDMLRNVFPFAEAWGEILSSWGKIMMQNPRMLRRVQQGVEGARGAGWFYEDPATGEEVFNYPGTGLLTQWMMDDNAGLQLAGGVGAGAIGGALGAGIPGAIGGGLLGGTASVVAGGLANQDAAGPTNVQLTGRVQGLNLIAGSYLPGFGPIVQLGMANLLSEQMNDPDNRWVRDLVMPFGAQEVDSPGEAIIDTALPAWFRKGLVSLAKGDGENQRLYANTVMDVYKALLSGTGSDQTPADAQITMDRAKKIAQNLYRIRALAQFAAPTGPSVRFDIRDTNGQMWTYINLAQEWARMQEENEYDEIASFEQFTQRFGLDPTLFATSKTTSIVKRSTTQQGVDWEYENQELFDPSSPYYTTAYYARPDDPFEPYDYNAYLQQLKQGTREGLTPEQWVTERNDFLGRIAYERARRMVGGRTDDAARGWLRQTRYQLMEEYPGYYSPTIGVRKRAERSQLMESFKLWYENDTLRETEAGQGLVRYLRARDAAITQVASWGITEQGFSSAKSAAHLRRWLQDIGRYLATIYPDFGPIYDQVMRREVEEDEEAVVF